MSVSPELALAVASVIKDKALEQQTNELISLRKQLQACHEIEITGRMGRPIYCRGSFNDGNFREIKARSPSPDHHLLWEVKLINETSDEGISLIDLGRLEIRLGGVVYATSSSVLGTRCRVRGAASDRSRDDLICIFCSGDGDTIYNRYNRLGYMHINFQSLPPGPWKQLQSCYLFNCRPENNDNRTDIFDLVTNPSNYPRRIPNQKADVTSISFNVGSVLKLVRNIYRDEEFEKTKETYIAQAEAQVEEIRRRF